MAAWNVTPGEYLLALCLSTATGQTAPTGVTVYGISGASLNPEASFGGDVTWGLVSGYMNTATSMMNPLQVGGGVTNVAQTGASVQLQPVVRFFA
jgi:hypothetical protein